MKSNLATLVKYGSKICSTRSGLPILQSVAFDRGYARVTDLESTLVIPISTDFAGVIPLSLIKKVLKVKPAEISIGDNAIEFDEARLNFVPKDLSEFPVIPEGEFKPLGTWEIMGKLADLAVFCSQDELRHSLLGVYVSQNGTFDLVASNGHYLKALTEISAPEGVFEGVIPSKPLKVFNKHGASEASVSDTHLKLDYADFTVYVRLVDERYPDWKSAVPEDCFGMSTFDRREVLAVVHNALQFAHKDTRLGVIDLEKTVLLAEDIEEGTQFEEPLPVINRQGDSIKGGFNFSCLQTVLEALDSEQVAWEYESPLTASVFNRSEHELTLLMPHRLTD